MKRLKRLADTTVSDYAAHDESYQVEVHATIDGRYTPRVYRVVGSALGQPLRVHVAGEHPTVWMPERQTAPEPLLAQIRGEAIAREHAAHLASRRLEAIA